MKKETSRAKIEFERCKGCELCVYYCPKKCLKVSAQFNSSGLHPAVLENTAKCSGCGTCYIICPEYAVTVD